ncbi:MAG: peptidylprolyl isomerase [Candidatus Thermoplasmatota archaeon]|nr:peptidylprolyl isomerase [Candidatus Thermoplasmatota archaeon]
MTITDHVRGHMAPPLRKAAYAVLVLALLALAMVRSASAAPYEDGVIYTEAQDIGRPNRIAVIEVKDHGIIKFELYENMTPITTQNFIDLAQSGFYDGIKFHRCIDDFVAQTGDPNTRNLNPYDDGMGGSGKTIPLEINHDATHIDGALGMARSSEPDSASSQFYICDGPQHGLDDKPRMDAGNGHGYAVFGVVIEGLDVAKRIAATETYGNRRPLLKDHPVDDIVMTKVYIIEGEWDNKTEDEPVEKGEARTLPFPTALVSASVIAVLITKKLCRSRKV